MIPPPLPKTKRKWLPFWAVTAVIVAFIAGTSLTALVVTLQIRNFYMRGSAMAPAIKAGDYVAVERLSYWHDVPRRGDIVVFRTDQISRDEIPFPIPSDSEPFVMRVVGLPGESLRLDHGALYVNGSRVHLRNQAGEIQYNNSRMLIGYLRDAHDIVTVPSGSYFVLGDNSARSNDSRYWGFVPAASVVGRVVWCYWPSLHAGHVQWGSRDVR